MTDSPPATRSTLRSPRTQYVSLWVLAGLGYGLLIAVGYPLAAVAVFVLGGAGAVLRRGTASGTLFDERDARLSRDAAHRTLSVVGMASAVFFPVAVVLYALGYHTWPPWLAYLGWYVAGLWLLYGAVRLLVRRQS